MKTFIKIICGIITILGFVCSINIIIDPYIHYHVPLDNVNYWLNNKYQRYVNDGIIRHFSYNSVIIGTSMTENFKTKQFDNLFKTNSIKINFSGASYKEIDTNLKKALKYNKNIRIVLRGIDYGSIIKNANYMSYNEFPTYLYDNNIFNDYKYLLNKDVFFTSLYSLFNKNKIDLNDFSNWRYKNGGKTLVLKGYSRKIYKNIQDILSTNEVKMLKENINQNIIDVALKYPKVKFIYFITPYSIAFWDSINREGNLKKQIKAEEIMIKMILNVPNIELYSFYNNYELITNLNNYIDTGHYTWPINDKILEWIFEGKYRITKDNYKKYIKNNLEFYSNYNYDKIFEE